MVGADPTRATPHTALSPEAAPAKAGLGLSAYQLVTRAGTPLAGAVLRYRRRQHKEDPARMYERFGQTETPRPQGTFVWLHAASVGETNAILPVITLQGLQFGALLGGAVITEIVFAWPGVGRLLLDAILRRDYPVVQGTVIFVAIAYVFMNLVVDLLYHVVDPRLRQS